MVVELYLHPISFEVFTLLEHSRLQRYARITIIREEVSYFKPTMVFGFDGQV